MSLAASDFALPARRLHPGHVGHPSLPVVFRGLLKGGCLASAGLAAWVGDPSTFLRADAELGYLLRGMAAIKATLVLAACAVLWWRFGHNLSQRIAAAYLAGTCLVAGATALIWQLSFVPLAAVLFHTGTLALLLAAWADHRLGKPGRAATPVP